MVGRCGGCDMGGWIWWPVALGCERETLRKERERKREEYKRIKMIKKEYLNEVLIK